MPNSINGWEVLDNPPWGDPRAKNKKVPATGTDLWVRKEAWPLFAALVTDYNKAINKVTSSDGYDYRQSRVNDRWSNHSSGTAIDINASAEGATGLAWTKWWKTLDRNRKAQRIRKMYQIVTWGAWTGIADDPHTPEKEGWDAGSADAMHWELKSGTTVEDVKKVIKFLGINANGVRNNDINGNPLPK